MIWYEMKWITLPIVLEKSVYRPANICGDGQQSDSSCVRVAELRPGQRREAAGTSLCFWLQNISNIGTTHRVNIIHTYMENIAYIHTYIHTSMSGTMSARKASLKAFIFSKIRLSTGRIHPRLQIKCSVRGRWAVYVCTVCMYVCICGYIYIYTYIHSMSVQ